MPRDSREGDDSITSADDSSVEEASLPQPTRRTLFSSDSDSVSSREGDVDLQAVQAKDIAYNGISFLEKLDESSRAEVMGIGKVLYKLIDSLGKDPSSLLDVLVHFLSPLVHYLQSKLAVAFKDRTSKPLTDIFLMGSLMVLILAGTYGMSPSDWFNEATDPRPTAVFFVGAPNKKDFTVLMHLIDSFVETPSEKLVFRRPESTHPCQDLCNRRLFRPLFRS